MIMSSIGSPGLPRRDSSWWAVTLTLVLAFSSATGNAGTPGGVTLSKTTVAVTEGAATDSYTVVLNSAPTSNVSVIVNGNADVSGSPSSLTFTPANWNVAQPVTVTAVNDRIYEADHSATITHSSVSSDANYNGLTIAAVTANVSDNEFIVFGISDVNGNFAPTSGEEGVTTVTFNMLITVNSPAGGSGSFGFDLGFQLPYSVTAGTATGGGVDYTLADGSSSFTATQSLASPTVLIPFTATIVDDALPEPAETITITAGTDEIGTSGSYAAGIFRTSFAPYQAHTYTILASDNEVAPSIAYNPTTGSSVAFTGVTTIGTTGNGTIAATPSGGTGTGAPATTTINSCTLGGTNPGSFAGAAAINLSFVGNTTTPQNLALTCTSQQTAQTATLTCNETRGSDAPVQRQWPLNCPAGTLSPLTSAPVSGTTVNLSGIAGGATTTSTITVTNPNPIAVELTCTAPAFPFTATPLVFSIPNGGNAPITVGISPAAGSYTGTLNCAVSGSSQVLTFSLTGSVAAPTAVNATSMWGLMVLMLSLFGFAAVAVRRQG
jgi:hypothetical protein